MKRLCSLLLTIAILMAGTALAEGAPEGRAYHMAMSWSLSQENVAEMMDVLGMNPDKDLAQGLAELFDSLKVDIAFSEDQKSAGFVMTMKDREWYSMQMVQTDDAILYGMSMCPGLTLRMPKDALYTAYKDLYHFSPEEADAWAHELFPQLLSRLAANFSAMADKRSLAPEIGRFAGDAYTGGVTRVSGVLDDCDLSLVLLRTLSDCPNALDIFKTIPAFDEKALSDLLMNAAWENRYSYKYSVVWDENSAPRGASVTVFDGETQMATLSLGLRGEKAITAVLGFGVNGQVWYVDADAEVTEGEDAEIAAATVSAHLIRDRNALGYQAAKAQPDAVQAAFELNIENDSAEVRWDASLRVAPWSWNLTAADQAMREQMPALRIGAKTEELFVTHGSLRKDTMEVLAEYNLYLNGADQPCMKAVFTGSWGDAIKMPEGGQVIQNMLEMTEEEQNLMTEALSKAAQQMLITMLRTVPPSLVTWMTRQSINLFQMID